jgi:hypothetical protein
MHRSFLVLVCLALVGGCASHGTRRIVEGAALGGGGAALAGELLTGPVGLAAGAVAGSGAGAWISSKTARVARQHHYHHFVPVYTQ